MQFDVFVNPITAARRAYPYVVVLQSDFAQGVRDSIVAPLVAVQSMPTVAGHLTPIVTVEESDYRVIVPALAPVRRKDFRALVVNVASARSDLLDALNYFFFGI